MTGRLLDIMTPERLKGLNIGDSNRIDTFVGLRIRRRRTMLGISQGALADALGLTFQQIQKYEKGQTRISVGRLWDIGKILGVPFTYFFETLDGKVFTPSQVPFSPVLAEEQDSYSVDPLARRDVRDLLKAYCAISDPQMAKNILRVVKDLAASSLSSYTEEPEEEENT